MTKEEFLLKWEDWGVRPIDLVAYKADIDALLRTEVERLRLRVQAGEKMAEALRLRRQMEGQQAPIKYYVDMIEVKALESWEKAKEAAR